MLPADASPVCADPIWLPLIDAAFAVGGAGAAHEFTEKACRHCPEATACLGEAMAGPEHGPWGGLTGRARTVLSGRSPVTKGNLGSAHPVGRKLPSTGEVPAA